MKFDKGKDNPEVIKMADEVEQIAKEQQEQTKADLVFDEEDFNGEGISKLGEDKKEEEPELKPETEVKDESDDEIDKLIADATNATVEVKTELRKKQIEDYEEIEATKELLFSRAEKKIPIKVPVNDKELFTFYAKRISEREMQKYFDRKLMTKDQRDLTDKEQDTLLEKNYELFARVIVEPKMDSKEWEKIDAPLAHKLGVKVAALLSDTDESALLEDFKKK